MRHGEPRPRAAGVCVCMVCVLLTPTLHASAPAQEPASAPAQQGPRRVPAPRIDVGVSLERGGEAVDAGPRLVPIGGGRLQHSDGRGPASVEPVGRGKFRDVKRTAGAQVAGFDPFARRWTPPKEAARDAFESEALYPAGPPTAPTMVGIGASFGGASDWLIGTRHAAAKTRFLRDTEALRMRMAHAFLQQRLAEQLDGLVDQLLGVWRDGSLSLAERRRRIFVAWDDCDEARPGAVTAVDEIRGEAATQARGKIVRLIRVIAPRGSPQQYTPAELAELNARRRSRGRFAPYEDP